MRIFLRPPSHEDLRRRSDPGDRGILLNENPGADIDAYSCELRSIVLVDTEDLDPCEGP